MTRAMTRLPRSRAARAVLACWVTLALAAGFAAWAGTRYASAASGSGSSGFGSSGPGSSVSGSSVSGGSGSGGSGPAPTAVQAARDAAVSAGTREIADLNSVSARAVARWEQRWLGDTTGAERARIQRTNPAAAAQIEKVKTSSAATVTAAALTALSVAPDGRAGTARLIATVSVVHTNAAGVSDTVANRYLATLTLTTAGWKISSLTGG